ncbi:MAG: nuclear transport factor 2 family protein [Cytophagales bacterium]|nr:nuclear transport factor 2 family protein [Cytophagales bacterium]
MKLHLITALGVLFAFLIISGKPKSTENMDYKTYFEAFFGYFNAHDWEAMANMYADTVSVQDPALGFGSFEQSRADIIAHYTALNEMIPDVKDSVISIHPSGNTVIVEFISMGTAPDGTRFSLPICAIMTFENGLIVKDHVYYDNF